MIHGIKFDKFQFLNPHWYDAVVLIKIFSFKKWYSVPLTNQIQSQITPFHQFIDTYWKSGQIYHWFGHQVATVGRFQRPMNPPKRIGN